MWIFTHWAFTHSVIFLIGMYLGWNHFLQPAWIRTKTRWLTTWLNNNLMAVLTLRNVIWFATLISSLANSAIFKGAKGGMATIKTNLLSVSMFLTSIVGDVVEFTTKTKDINKVDTKDKEGDTQ